MEESRKRIGKKVRLILKNQFHYTGKIINEDDLFFTILDKFNVEVQLAKSSIEVMEILK